MKIACLLLLLFLGITANIDDISSSIVKGIVEPIQYNLKTNDTQLGMDSLKIAVDPASGQTFGVFHQVNQATRYSELYAAKKNWETGEWSKTTKLSERGSQASIYVIN